MIASAKRLSEANFIIGIWYTYIYWYKARQRYDGLAAIARSVFSCKSIFTAAFIFTVDVSSRFQARIRHYKFYMFLFVSVKIFSKTRFGSLLLSYPHEWYGFQQKKFLITTFGGLNLYQLHLHKSIVKKS